MDRPYIQPTREPCWFWKVDLYTVDREGSLNDEVENYMF